MNHDQPLPLPPVPAPYQLPFHYGALHNIGIDYLVDPAPVREVLAERHPELTAADFDGRACVSLNYQLYFAQYPNGGGITQEIEVNIIAHPTGAAGRLGAIGYQEYARGVDQTKLLGIARIHVLCDNPLAIDAGTKLYAEPKYPGWFETTMPSSTAPPRTGPGRSAASGPPSPPTAPASSGRTMPCSRSGPTWRAWQPRSSTTPRSPATAPIRATACWPAR